MSFPGYASFPCSRQARTLPVTLMWGGVISQVRQFPLLEASQKVASDFNVRRCHFPGTPVSPARGKRESYQWLWCEAVSFPRYASFPCLRQARKLPVTLMWSGVISRVRQLPLLEASQNVASDFNVIRCHFLGTPVSPARGQPECCQWLYCEAVSFPGYASFPFSRQARMLPVTLMWGGVISRVRQFPLLEGSQNVASDFNVRRCHFPGTPVSSITHNLFLPNIENSWLLIHNPPILYRKMHLLHVGVIYTNMCLVLCVFVVKK